MAEQTRRPDRNHGPTFQVFLNGFLMRECWTEQQAIDVALDLKPTTPRSEISILNLRTGHKVPVPDPSREASPPFSSTRLSE